MYPEHTAKKIYGLFADINFFIKLEPIPEIYDYVINLNQEGYDVRFFSNKQSVLHTEFHRFFQTWSQFYGLANHYDGVVPLILWDNQDELKDYIKAIEHNLVEVVDDYPNKLHGLVSGIKLTVPLWPYNEKQTYQNINPLCLTHLDHTSQKG